MTDTKLSPAEKWEAEQVAREAKGLARLEPPTEAQNLFSASTVNRGILPSTHEELQVPSTRPVEDRDQDR